MIIPASRHLAIGAADIAERFRQNLQNSISDICRAFMEHRLHKEHWFSLTTFAAALVRWFNERINMTRLLLTAVCCLIAMTSLIGCHASGSVGS